MTNDAGTNPTAHSPAAAHTLSAAPRPSAAHTASIVDLPSTAHTSLTVDTNPTVYTNPILDADWSDPDVVRVGDDFYLTASSFGRAPGLPLLHSRDLVNRTLVGHALQRLEPAVESRTPRHDRGVRAPRCATTRTASGSSGATPTRASSRSTPLGGRQGTHRPFLGTERG